MRIVTIIPALDEEEAIGRVVQAIPRTLIQEVIVVDNGSQDNTATVARTAGATVVVEPQRGYGAACLAGTRAACRADILVFLDGDASDDPAEIARVLQPILDGQAEVVLGSRTTGQGDQSGLTPQQRVGNFVVTRLVRLLYGIALTDIGPFRAITTAAFQTLGMEHKTYGWPVEMVVKAAKKGYRIVEVPVSCHKRIGRSKIAGTVKGSLLAGYHLLRTTLRYAWRD
ncbi:MAG: glycosyltransferase family 2 protein [Candidatus Tectimicrobiota bacterium]